VAPGSQALVRAGTLPSMLSEVSCLRRTPAASCGLQAFVRYSNPRVLPVPHGAGKAKGALHLQSGVLHRGAAVLYYHRLPRKALQVGQRLRQHAHALERGELGTGALRRLCPSGEPVSAWQAR